MWSLTEFIPESFVIDVLDVGASMLDVIDDPYGKFISSRHVHVVGFEPDQSECDRLNLKYQGRHRFFPYFVGDGRPAVFHQTNNIMTGSLFPPNSPLLEKFQNLAEVVTPVSSHPVETRRLDDVEEIADIDFFKIDVQGGELAVFQNALRILADALVVQVEVEFVELYKGQPMFSDVDAFLRSQGFQFHTFAGIGSNRCFKPMVVGNDINRGLRQILWADAIYVRDWMSLDCLSEEKLLTYAVLAHDVVQSYDLAHLVLRELDGKIGSDLADSYMARLSGGAA